MSYLIDCCHYLLVLDGFANLFFLKGFYVCSYRTINTAQLNKNIIMFSVIFNLLEKCTVNFTLCYYFQLKHKTILIKTVCIINMQKKTRTWYFIPEFFLSVYTLFINRLLIAIFLIIIITGVQ